MTEPTDAELDALLLEHDMMCQWPKQYQVHDFARAVLAKWGTPAPVGVGEVAERYRNAIASACEGWTMPDGLRKHLETALWSPPTPQPTQAQPVARLEIESLQARIKTMAEEHADELMVAHLDGRMRAAQPAGAGQRRSDLVPGVMHCAKCKFQLNRVTLCVSDGNAYAGNNETEPCPNGCGPLWPVTWEQEARNCWKALEEMHERLHPAPTPQADSQPAPANTRQIAECYGDCPTDPKTCANPCKFEGRAARAPADSVLEDAALPDEVVRLAQVAIRECQYKGNDMPQDWMESAMRACRLIAASRGQAPAPPPECETEAEKRAFAFGWFKALESERMKAESAQEDAARLERERICAAIKAEDDYCVENGGYMLDSDDCIKIVRGEWVRPAFSADAARKQGATP